MEDLTLEEFAAMDKGLQMADCAGDDWEDQLKMKAHGESRYEQEGEEDDSDMADEAGTPCIIVDPEIPTVKEGLTYVLWLRSLGLKFGNETLLVTMSKTEDTQESMQVERMERMQQSSIHDFF